MDPLPLDYLAVEVVLNCGARLDIPVPDCLRTTAEDEPVIGAGEVRCYDGTLHRKLAVQGVHVVVGRSRLQRAAKQLLQGQAVVGVDDYAGRSTTDLATAMIDPQLELDQAVSQRSPTEVGIRGRLVRLVRAPVETGMGS